MLKRLPALALLLMASLLIIFYWQTNKEKEINENLTETPQVNLSLSQEKPQLLEISEEEALEVERVIAWMTLNYSTQA